MYTKNSITMGILALLTVSSISYSMNEMPMQSMLKEYKFIYGYTGQIFSVTAYPMTSIKVFKQWIADKNMIPAKGITIMYRGKELINDDQLALDVEHDVFNVLIPRGQHSQIKWHPHKEFISNLPPR